MRPLSGLCALGLALSATVACRDLAHAGSRKPAPWHPSVSPAVSVFRTPSATPLTSNPLAALDAPPNDKCSGAIPIPCGNISLSGNTINATNDYDFPDTTLSCTTYSAGGRDVVYSFTAVAGDSVWLRYQSSADASIYLVTDCSNVTASCVAGSDNTRLGQVEDFRYGFKTSGTYYLILDSYGQDTFGTWTLVGQFLSCGFHAPANDRCDTATRLYCGPIVTSGSTASAFNDYSFPSLGASCTNSLAGGRDVAYELDVSAGDSLHVNYTSTADGVIYLMTGCDVGPGTCVAGVNNTGTGATEAFNYKFAFTGTYFLILDSDGNDTFGSWTLNGSLVCAQPPPANDQCAGAPPIYCGPFSLSGSTALATDDYDLPDTSCTGYQTLGPDVVYRVDAAPGESLWVDYQSTADASVYIVTNCANVAGSCVAGSDNTGTNGVEHLEYKFPSRGAYYLILDSYDYNVPGDWTANGALICPATTGVGGSPGADFHMAAAAPNPFSRATTMRFSVAQRGHAVLRVYDLTGRVVRTLLDADLGAGERTVTWDARDDQGQRVRVGTYYARLMSGGKVAYRTLVFVH